MSPDPALAPAGPAGGATVHPDRVRAGAGLGAALAGSSSVALGVAGMLASVRSPLGAAGGLVLGSIAGLLAVVGLRSLSVRLVSRLVAAASAALMVRLAVVGEDLTSAIAALAVWLLAMVGVAVLSGLVPEGDHDLGAPPATPAARVRRPRPSAVLGRILATWAIVVVVVVVALPLVLARLGDASSAGDPARPADRSGDPTPLTASDRLDMTDRPRLSDRLVMTVRAEERTFWREETFDRWDGRYWTRSDDAIRPLGPGGTVDPAPDDLAADGPDRITQTFHLRTPFAQVLPAAPAATRADAPSLLAQREDGTLLPAPPLGPGATYTVESRRIPMTAATLRAAEGPVPAEIRTAYAAPPTTTERVRVAAVDAVAGATTTYDRVLALQEWMGSRTQYSLDAPLAPPGADVVDDFLFESRRGWCEQIASSLVVLARVNGIPARLATGYVPGERSPLTGEFQVRERDGHAWAEVWFPDVGWVPFDPTADVPLAGEDQVTMWSDWLAEHGWEVVGGLVLLVAAVVGAVVLARRLRRRHRRPSPTWVGSIESRLDALGERAGRPRGSWETATTHARALGSVLRIDELAEVGRVADAGTYAPVPPSDAERAEAERILDRAREAVPVAPGGGHGPPEATTDHPQGVAHGRQEE